MPNPAGEQAAARELRQGHRAGGFGRTVWSADRGRYNEGGLSYKTMKNDSTLRLGARGSLLSRMQSRQVADALEKRHPGLRVESLNFKTSGDVIADRPLHEAGGKGLFTRELELALLEGRIDFAVHSFKDVPVTMPLVEQAQLTVAAVPVREDVRDVLVCAGARRIEDLPRGAKVGTGSLRRRCQLLAVRPDLDVQPIRGNVDTRLKKVREGQYAAIVLAMAGLRRSGLFDEADMMPLDAEAFLPAAGQGALAIQCRSSDQSARGILAALNDPGTAQCVNLERELVRKLNGDCYSPIAARAQVSRGRIKLQAAVGARGGGLPVVRSSAQAPIGCADEALEQVFNSLVEQGALNRLA